MEVPRDVGDDGAGDREVLADEIESKIVVYIVAMMRSEANDGRLLRRRGSDVSSSH